jgi:hypothetical protein
MELVNWIHLAQNRDQWQALVNTVMNLRVPWKLRNFLTEWLSASQGLCSMELGSQFSVTEKTQQNYLHMLLSWISIYKQHFYHTTIWTVYKGTRPQHNIVLPTVGSMWLGTIQGDGPQSKVDWFWISFHNIIHNMPSKQTAYCWYWRTNLHYLVCATV